MAFIVMKHKETGGVASVDEAAFRDVWSNNGWTKVTKASRKTSDAHIQSDTFAEAKADAKTRTAKQRKGGN